MIKFSGLSSLPPSLHPFLPLFFGGAGNVPKTLLMLSENPATESRSRPLQPFKMEVGNKSPDQVSRQGTASFIFFPLTL